MKARGNHFTVISALALLASFFWLVMEAHGTPEPAYGKIEILRDRWGIAHGFSETDEGAMYGLGYATASVFTCAMSRLAPDALKTLTYLEGWYAKGAASDMGHVGTALANLMPTFQADGGAACEQIWRRNLRPGPRTEDAGEAFERGQCCDV